MERISLRECCKDYAVVLLAPLLLLGPLLARGLVIFWGTASLQFIPWWVYAAGSLRQGSLPLWNALNGMGAPLVANYQSAIFYPPNWILLLFAFADGARGTAIGFTLLSILHLSWAGLGMAFLLRQMRFPWLAQIIGGLAFGLSGYIVGRLSFFSMAWAAAWIPWVIYASSVCFQRSPKSLARGVMVLAFCFGMQLLSGHAQLSWYTILLAGLWVTFGAIQDGGFRRLLRAWAVLAAAGLLGAALAAVQLIPTAEYLRLSFRADAVAYEDALTYSFWPWRFVTLFAPDFFGNPAAGDYWGYASYWEDHVYAGLLPLVLALASLVLLVRGFRKTRRDPRWSLLGLLWALSVVTFALALGRYAPFFPFLYRHVPTFNMFQAPARYLIWFAFAIPLLAAVTIEHWRSPTGRGLYWFRLGTAGAFAITIGAGLALVFLTGVRLTFIRATALAGLWGLGFGLLTLAIPYAQQRGRTRFWQGLVIIWTLADLLVSGYSLNPGYRWDMFQGTTDSAASVRALAGDTRIYLPKQEESDLKFRRFMRFYDFRPLEDWRELRESLIPDLNLLEGLPSANNFDPLQPETFVRWVEAINGLDPATQAGWLALAGVGAVERIDGTQPHGIRFDVLPNAARWRWYSCAVMAGEPETAWSALQAEMQAPPSAERAVIIEQVTGQQPASCANQPPASIQLASERPDRLAFSVSTLGPGWLVVYDTWYPGWVAKIDGINQPLFRADGNFRAVEVESGKHQISMQYRPVGFLIGAILSILVLLLGIIIQVVHI